MNMFLHRVHPENQHLRNGDTLDADWPTDEETEFDVVTMNPPYSAKWSAAEGFKQDERFMDYGGKLAPKSKADYAFLLHGFYHLKQTGVTGVTGTSSQQLRTRRDLQLFSERYTQEFTQGTSVSLTYHPIYIIAKKKKV